jgi:hypothetical protein
MMTNVNGERGIEIKRCIFRFNTGIVCQSACQAMNSDHEILINTPWLRAGFTQRQSKGKAASSIDKWAFLLKAIIM